MSRNKRDLVHNKNKTSFSQILAQAPLTTYQNKQKLYICCISDTEKAHNF